MLQTYIPYLQAALALVGVVLLILGTSWVLKRFSGLSGFMAKDSGEIKVKTMKQIDPKAKLVVVNWRNSAYLIGITDQGFHVIDQDMSGTNKEDTHVKS